MTDVSGLLTPAATAGTYPSIPAGTNRLMFMTVGVLSGSGNATAPSGVKINGIDGVFVGGDTPSTVQSRATLSTWFWGDASAASISSGTIVISGAAGDSIRGHSWAVKDAKQSAPTRTAKQYIATGACSIPLARAASSWTFFAVNAPVAEDLTLTNPSRLLRILNVNMGFAVGTAQTVNSTTQSKTYVQTAHVINIESAPAQAITSITPDPILVGGSFTLGTSGFSDGSANFTIGGVTVGVTISSNSATATFPSFSDLMQLPFLPATSQTSTLVQSALTATKSVGVGLPTGFDVTRDGGLAPANFAGIVTSDPKYIGYHFLAAGNPLTTNDRCYWPMMTISGKSISIGQDGRVLVPEELYSGSDPVVVPLWIHRASGVIYAHEMTVPREGAITITRIHAPASSKIIARGIVARGIVAN